MSSKKSLGGSLGSKISKKISGKISDTLHSKMNLRFDPKVNEQIKRSVQTATTVAQAGLDQVLLGLQHKGLTLKKAEELLPTDLMQSVGRKILERAESVRATLATQPMSPSWLKEFSLDPLGAKQKTSDANESDVKTAMSASDDAGPAADLDTMSTASHDGAAADVAGSATDETLSKAAKGMQPESKADRKDKTAGSSKKKTKVSSTSKQLHLSMNAAQKVKKAKLAASKRAGLK